MGNYRNHLSLVEKLDRFIVACSQTITKSMFRITADDPESGAHHDSILCYKTGAKKISSYLSNPSSFLDKFYIAFPLRLPWVKISCSSLVYDFCLWKIHYSCTVSLIPILETISTFYPNRTLHRSLSSASITPENHH